MTQPGQGSGAAGQTLSDIMTAVRATLEPGEKMEAGCDGRVTRRVPFLGNRAASGRQPNSHFVAVTDRRVLVFAIAPRLFHGGLAQPAALQFAAPRETVSVAKFKARLLTSRVQLKFIEGIVPFEVRGPAAVRQVAAKIAGLLPRS